MRFAFLLSLILWVQVSNIHAQDNWISVSRVARPSEIPQTIDIGVLQTYVEEYRGKLVAVMGILSQVSFEEVEGKLRGLASLHVRNYRMTLLFSPEASRVELSQNVLRLNGAQVKIIARIVDRTMGSKIYGLEVDSIRRAKDRDGEDLELLDIPRHRRSRSPRIDSTYPDIGAQNIRLGAEFRITFTEKMKPGSFNGRVRLLYPRPPKQIESSIECEIEYMEKTRTLLLQPKGDLAAGREVQIQLLRGITGVDGQTLSRLDESQTKRMTSRRSAGVDRTNEIVATLRFYTRRR